jgi:hypothetical protein
MKLLLIKVSDLLDALIDSKKRPSSGRGGIASLAELKQAVKPRENRLAKKTMRFHYHR